MASHLSGPPPADTEGQDCTLSLGKANLLSLLVAPPSAFLLALLYVLRWDVREVRSSFTHLPGGVYTFLGLCLAFIVLHEFIHALAWMVIGRKGSEEISFGFHLKTLTPYAHVRGRLDVTVYRWGTAMPGLLQGIIPSLAGIITGDAVVMALGVVFTAAAGGDWLILWLLRHAPRGAVVEDHPQKAGCTVYPRDPAFLREEKLSGETGESP